MERKILGKELIDDAALWRLGMAVDSRGVDVLVRRVAGQHESVTARIDFAPEARSMAAALEEAVYANPLLLLPFSRVDVAVRTPRVMAVPAGVEAATLAGWPGLESGDSLLDGPLDADTGLVFVAERALVNFLSRTYDLVPGHVLSSLAAYYAGRSRGGNSDKMYVELTPAGSLQVLVYDSAGLARACAYTTTDTAETAYRLLALFTGAGLDAETAEIHIAAPAALRSPLVEMLTPFVRHVLPAVPPTAAYSGDVQALSAPVSLLTMLL